LLPGAKLANALEGVKRHEMKSRLCLRREFHIRAGQCHGSLIAAHAVDRHEEAAQQGEVGENAHHLGRAGAMLIAIVFPSPLERTRRMQRATHVRVDADIVSGGVNIVQSVRRAMREDKVVHCLARLR
jgi:hypothetical protein